MLRCRFSTLRGAQTPGVGTKSRTKFARCRKRRPGSRTKYGLGHMPRFRLRWWEWLLLVPPIGVALLFLVGGLILPGAVLVALLVILVASRAELVERNVAGAYANARGTLLWIKALAFFSIYLVIVVLAWVARRDDWSDETSGSTAVWALAGLSFFVLRDVIRLGRQAENSWRGGDEERKVGQGLDKLRDEGWIVSHNLVRDDEGGNVDHFVVGPTGAFAVETKTGRSNASARAQAVGNAVWAKKKFGQRWVTAVLCVGTNPPTKPEKHGWVWVLGLDDLADFVRQPPR